MVWDIVEMVVGRIGLEGGSVDEWMKKIDDTL
jgi:hypothetical protein